MCLFFNFIARLFVNASIDSLVDSVYLSLTKSSTTVSVFLFSFDISSLVSRASIVNLEYFSNGKSVYQLYNHKEYEDFDIQELSKLENGDYEFIVNFYNGVTWLGEIIEEFINKLEE